MVWKVATLKVRTFDDDFSVLCVCLSVICKYCTSHNLRVFACFCYTCIGFEEHQISLVCVDTVCTT